MRSRCGLVAPISALILFGAACRPSPPEQPAYRCEGCNIVLISMDTLRADHVGAYGYTERPTTPNIDALAKRGVLFENAVSQSSWTRPAHLSIFTGLYPSEHGITALRDRRRLHDSIPTLAAELGRVGYSTAAFTGGINVSAIFGFDRGFDVYRSNGKYFRDNWQDATYWLDKHADERFFLFFHGYDPHTPYLTDPIDRVALSLPDQPPHRSFRRVCRRDGKWTKRIEPFIAEYDGAIHRGDRYVGKLLQRLGKLELLNNTIVVFLSDHGEEFLEHGRCFHLTTLYREVLNVPLIIAAPGLESRRVSRLVPASVSIGATVLAMIGLREHALPGTSLLKPNYDEEELVVSETSRTREGGRGEGHLRSMTRPGDKLLHRITDERYERFDFITDPAERAPETSGDTLETMVSRLKQWTDSHPSRVDESEDRADTEPDADLQNELKSLGYVD